MLSDFSIHGTCNVFPSGDKKFLSFPCSHGLCDPSIIYLQQGRYDESSAAEPWRLTQQAGLVDERTGKGLAEAQERFGTALHCSPWGGSHKGTGTEQQPKSCKLYFFFALNISVYYFRFCKVVPEVQYNWKLRKSWSEKEIMYVVGRTVFLFAIILFVFVWCFLRKSMIYSKMCYLTESFAVFHIS